MTDDVDVLATFSEEPASSTQLPAKVNTFEQSTV